MQPGYLVLALFAAAFAAYVVRIGNGTVLAKRPWLFDGIVVLCLIGAVLSLFLGAGWGNMIAATLTLIGSGMMVYFISKAGMPKTRHLQLGETAPGFRALNAHRAPIAFEPGQGGLTLIKFYRGHWCPFCMSELQRWEAMKGAFDERGIRILYISPNTVEQAASMTKDLSIEERNLADPELEIIDLYGVRHKAALGGDPRDGKGVVRDIAVPTAFLVDKTGVIRWIDQAEDYRVRSDAERVLLAIDEVFAQA